MGSGSGSPNAEGAAHGSALGSVQVNVDSGATSSGVSQGRPASGKPPRPKTRSPGKPGWTSTYHLPHPSTMLMKNNPAGTSGVAQGCGLSAFQLSVLIATVISVWMLRDYLEVQPSTLLLYSPESFTCLGIRIWSQSQDHSTVLSVHDTPGEGNKARGFRYPHRRKVEISVH